MKRNKNENRLIIWTASRYLKLGLSLSSLSLAETISALRLYVRGTFLGTSVWSLGGWTGGSICFLFHLSINLSFISIPLSNLIFFCGLSLCFVSILLLDLFFVLSADLEGPTCIFPPSFYDSFFYIFLLVSHLCASPSCRVA